MDLAIVALTICACEGAAPVGASFEAPFPERVGAPLLTLREIPV
jgi:hypothetical protein